MLLGYFALASLSLLAPFDPSGGAEQTVGMECNEDTEDCCIIGRIPGTDTDVGDVEDCFYGSLRMNDDAVTTSTL